MAQTITVCCNLPNGLKVHLKSGAVIDFAGTNSARILGGHGVVTVDRAVWDEFVETYKDYPPFKNGNLFAREKLVDASAQAKDQAENKTGLERLDPKKLPKDITKAEK